jgi:hypothetical protein
MYSSIRTEESGCEHFHNLSRHRPTWRLMYFFLQVFVLFLDQIQGSGSVSSWLDTKLWYPMTRLPFDDRSCVEEEDNGKQCLQKHVFVPASNCFQNIDFTCVCVCVCVCVWERERERERERDEVVEGVKK